MVPGRVYDAADAAASRRAPARPRGRGGRSPTHGGRRVVRLRDDRRARPARPDPRPERAVEALELGLEMRCSRLARVRRGLSRHRPGHRHRRAARAHRAHPAGAARPRVRDAVQRAGPAAAADAAARRGAVLAREMDELRRNLPQRLPLLLEDRELSRQRDALGKRYGAEEELEVAGLRARAEADGFGLVQIDAGQLSHPEIVPVKDGQPVPLESLRASLSPEEFAAKGARLEALGDELRDLGRASRDRQRRFAADLRELVAAAARSLAEEEIGDIGRHVPDLALGPYLAELRDDIVAAVVELADSGPGRDRAPRPPSGAVPRQRRRRPHRADRCAGRHRAVSGPAEPDRVDRSHPGRSDELPGRRDHDPRWRPAGRRRRVPGGACRRGPRGARRLGRAEAHAGDGPARHRRRRRGAAGHAAAARARPGADRRQGRDGRRAPALRRALARRPRFPRPVRHPRRFLVRHADGSRGPLPLRQRGRRSLRARAPAARRRGCDRPAGGGRRRAGGPPQPGVDELRRHAVAGARGCPRGG